jgi:hypothetical protein
VDDLTEAAVAEVGSSSAVDLAAALAAVNRLALSLTAEEADAANEQAVRSVLPLLRAASSCSDKVKVVREGIKHLHMAAFKGELAEAGLQQKVQEALKCLASEVGTIIGIIRGRQAEGAERQQLQHQKAAASFSGGRE